MVKRVPIAVCDQTEWTSNGKGKKMVGSSRHMVKRTVSMEKALQDTAVLSTLRYTRLTCGMKVKSRI